MLSNRNVNIINETCEGRRRRSTDFALSFSLNDIFEEEEVLKDDQDADNAYPDLDRLYCVCDKLQVSRDVANFIGFYFLAVEMAAFVPTQRH